MPLVFKSRNCPILQLNFPGFIPHKFGRINKLSLIETGMHIMPGNEA